MSDALHDQIDAFEKAYDYDASYMHDLLDRSPAAFESFAQARQMTSFRDKLPADAHYVAAITVMQVEDCGTCLELNLKLALEVGVPRDLLEALLKTPESLPNALRDVREHTLAVLHGDQPDAEVAARIQSQYGSEAFAELALCIAGVRIYPALKRSLLKAGECVVNPLGNE